MQDFASTIWNEYKKCLTIMLITNKIPALKINNIQTLSESVVKYTGNNATKISRHLLNDI